MSRARDDSGGPDYPRAPDYRASGFGGTLAVLVAVVAGIGLGLADGSLSAVLACLGGATLAALGVRASQSGTNARRAAGSAGVVAGAVAFAGVAAFDGGAVPLLVGVSVAAAATNATVSLDDKVEVPAVGTARRSATVLSVGAVASVGLYAGVFSGVAGFTVEALAAVVTANELVALLALQVEVLLIAELLHRAVPILDTWLPEGRELREAALDRLDFRVEDLPREYVAFLVLQVVLALTAWGPRWFDAFLGSLSVFGTGIRLLLGSGVLHAALGAVVLALVGVLVARAGQLLVVAWAGNDPPGALARSAGGISALAVTAVLGLPPLAGAVAATAPASGGVDFAGTISTFGATATFAGGTAAVLFGVVFASFVLDAVVRPWVVTSGATGFAVAGAALAVASLVAAEAGGDALAVFAGVAAALAVHDLGSNAVELGAQVGPAGETRTGETAHAVATLAVGTGGVALATLTAFAMGSWSASVRAWRARLAVALLLLSVLCFAVLVGREE
ncbi:hypothetical protein [Halorussus litoreus]|uniref:hypothetical protein n=1 Tax=Halorussus litoreus TaxID=1710536 RepID=UPI0013007910|nr:hypothetical protein [Halorussus litoreus]